MFDSSKLDAYLTGLCQARDLPGVSAAIMGPDGLEYAFNYGFRDGAFTRPVDNDTLFGVASMSKSMTALCACILACEGRLDLNAPVSDFFPEFELAGQPREAATVRTLAMHTAGIPPMEPLEWSIAMNSEGRCESDWLREMKRTAPNPMATIDEVIDYVAHCGYTTLGAPGEIMSYSNEGYAVLCYVVDAAAGEPLEDFLDKRIFRPMKMTRSTLDTDASRARAIATDGNITALFEADEKGNIVGDEQWSILPPFRACACVKSTAHDMARYYQCLANKGVLDGEQVIPAKAVELMIGAGFPEQEKAVYCMGLNKRVEDGHVYCEHSGGLHGVSSEGGLLKDENYGFAVLCNEGDADPADLIWALYNWVLGYPLDRPHRWLFPVEEEFSQPQALYGSYICHEGVPVTAIVYQDEGRLMVEKDGSIYHLRHCGQGWFQLMNEKEEIQGRMHFLIRNGQAWGVQVFTRIYTRI